MDGVGVRVMVGEAVSVELGKDVTNEVAVGFGNVGVEQVANKLMRIAKNMES